MINYYSLFPVPYSLYHKYLTEDDINQQMILEVAILNVKKEMCEEFEAAFKHASEIISSISGYISHELQKCVEVPNRYILLVRWETIEAHTIGFRQSQAYQQWKQLLHHFYNPFPVVEHYYSVL